MATFVLSVGGSMIVPDGNVNAAFLKGLKSTLLSFARRGDRFIIVTGGGRTCRIYQAGLKEIKKVTHDELDWIGIYSTHLNGHLVRMMFGKDAHPTVLTNPTAAIKPVWKQSVLVAAGWKPGFSTDHDAVLLAKRFKADLVINISNVDYLYTKDPRKFKNAEKICDISWKEYRKMIGSKRTPGMNVPFDPVASKLADQSKMDVLLIGADMKNLSNVLSERPFRGTVIHR